MKPIFSIHAGEYLVSEYIEKNFPDYEIWIPSKDTGTDLLITNKKNRAGSAGIQVKFSKDFLPQMQPHYHSNLSACGWWTINATKLQNSNADVWILAPYSFINRQIHFIIIEPSLLLTKLQSIHGNAKIFNVYLWVTKNNYCFETRRLNKQQKNNIANQQYGNLITGAENFTSYLNNWSTITSKV
jgi:hypothetical protein